MRTNRQICWLAAVGAMVSVQGGASLAKHLFPVVGADGDILRLSGNILWPAIGTAVFSSALPFTLELVALKGLSKKTFSITLSVEPAIAALSGLLFLGEHLTVLQLVAMACVMTASVGSTLAAKR